MSSMLRYIKGPHLLTTYDISLHDISKCAIAVSGVAACLLAGGQPFLAAGLASMGTYVLPSNQ